MQTAWDLCQERVSQGAQIHCTDGSIHHLSLPLQGLRGYAVAMGTCLNDSRRERMVRDICLNCHPPGSLPCAHEHKVTRWTGYLACRNAGHLWSLYIKQWGRVQGMRIAVLLWRVSVPWWPLHSLRTSCIVKILTSCKERGRFVIVFAEGRGSSGHLLDWDPPWKIQGDGQASA